MAVFYSLYQSNRKDFAGKGMWYGRVTVNGTKTLRDIAEVIQRNASVKKSDVLAVLTELPEVLNDFLAEGHRIKIEGFGSFKISIATKGATTAKEFSTKNIKSSKILFMPDRVYGKNGAKGARYLADQLEFREWGGGKKADDENDGESGKG